MIGARAELPYQVTHYVARIDPAQLGERGEPIGEEPGWCSALVTALTAASQGGADVGVWKRSARDQPESEPFGVFEPWELAELTADDRADLWRRAERERAVEHAAAAESLLMTLEVASMMAKRVGLAEVGNDARRLAEEVEPFVAELHAALIASGIEERDSPFGTPR